MTTESVWSSEAGARPSAWSAVTWFAAAVAQRGARPARRVIWGEAAPRALLQEISAGTAELMNVETRAFIGADVWFCGIAAVAGLLTGFIGYRFCIARHSGGTRAVIAACLILGGVAGAFVMLWLGEQIGLSAYNEHLALQPQRHRLPGVAHARRPQRPGLLADVHRDRDPGRRAGLRPSR